MDIGFDQALIIFGLLLVTLTALSGWLNAAVLSASVLAVGSGAGLAWAGVVSVSQDSAALVGVVEIALILTLFSDGMEVERELLRSHWRPSLRALVIAMPITLVLLALGAHTLFPDLSWAEAALLGAILMPTDPVITASVVSSTAIPARVRHTLNIESGLNDGLALPFVVVLIAIVAPGGHPLDSGLRLAGESVGGALIGAALATTAGYLLRRAPDRAIEPRFVGLLGLGIALATYGIADATIGNGLLAAFVAGIALALTRVDVPELSRGFNASLSTGVQLVTLFLFGTLIVTVGWSRGILPLIGFILFTLLVARPLAVLVSFTGIDYARAEKLFIAWFGPKGIASILFSLLVLGSLAPDRTLVFEIASFTVLGSILAHGMTDTLGARWISIRTEGRASARAPGDSDKGSPVEVGVGLRGAGGDAPGDPAAHRGTGEDDRGRR